ncbi:TPM domain-containing protein [Puniceicoccus vermicola]|uniref:TPM domain-containing protein n=1 Tax=Puniceicoccus vermicola TaxID=388746 RepID=A0A7X1B424_9BACT|nr:TPM domain-containing protein [Puniceicoccus vermicola]MBC2604123.1 TPM domain-containing protein [Puniceicoccus vermicola]
MNKYLRILFFSLVFLGFVGCSENPTNEKEDLSNFPDRPKNHPFFHNSSTLQSINEVAIGDLERAQRYTGIEYAMVLMEKLPSGYTAETAAVEIFDQWGIGREHDGRGVLYLFVEEDGVLKIEVGYALEEVFPDAFVGSFQETLKDYYRGEYFGDVVSSMIINMMRRAQGADVQAMIADFRGGLPVTEEASQMARDDYLSGGAGVTESEFIRNRTERLRNVVFLGEDERRLYDKDPDVETVVKRYLESLKQGINDPYLPLLTEGSQFMRMEYPKNSGFQKNAYRRFSGPYKIDQSGDYAAVRFERPDVMPILLRKDNDGDWQADITKSWAYSQATNNLKTMNPAYGDHAWIFAWQPEFLEPEVPATPLPLAKEKSLVAEIERLETAIEKNPEDADNYFELADLFYFECYWIRDAMQLIEQGLEYDPRNNLYRKRYIDFAYRYPDLSHIARHREAIFTYDPGDFLNINSYRRLLKRNRPAGYEMKIDLLDNVEDRKLLPRFPFALSADSARYKRQTFYVSNPRGTNRIRVNYRFFAAQWHDRFTPQTRIYLYDSEQESEFGLTLTQTVPNGPIIVAPMTGDESLGFDPREFPSDQPINFEFDWTAGKEIALLIDNEKVLEMPSTLTPWQVITYQRSGSSIIDFQSD